MREVDLLLQLSVELEGLPSAPGLDHLRATLDRLRSGKAASFDHAWGFQNGAGESWRRRLLLAQRDELLRQVMRRHFPEADLPGQRLPASEKLATRWNRYLASAWKGDRGRTQCPHPDGSLERDLFELSKLNGKALSAWTIRDLLDGRECETPLLLPTEQR